MVQRADHDIDTLPFATEGDMPRQQRVACLTVLAHPQQEMIGARAFLQPLEQGQVIELSRLAPDFSAPNGQLTQPLRDPYASRQPTVLSYRDGVLLTPPIGDSRVLVAGQPLSLPKRLEWSALERGVVLELSNRTVLLLHVRAPAVVAPMTGLVGGSEALDTVRQQIARAAPFAVPVLVTGETGVGKELVARALHEASPRKDGPWVAVNVAEIKADTAASVLFGHVRGAFTGATQDHDGLFVRADGGTLFLDEIGEMAADVQAMLLRVLETGEVQRLGDRKLRKVDVRVVAATDQELGDRGPVRSPLLYRLAGYHVHVPPLRQRLEDLGTLIAHFCDEEMARVGQTGRRVWLSAGLVTQLAAHKWPGNARELRNLVRTLVIQADGEERLGRGFSLDAWLGGERAEAPPRRPRHVETPQLSDETVAATLARNQWSLAATARELGIARSTLYLLIDRSTVLRTAADVTVDELRDAWVRAHGDLDAMAPLLRVSPHGLRLVLRTSGWLDGVPPSEGRDD